MRTVAPSMPASLASRTIPAIAASSCACVGGEKQNEKATARTPRTIRGDWDIAILTACIFHWSFTGDFWTCAPDTTESSRTTGVQDFSEETWVNNNRMRRRFWEDEQKKYRQSNAAEMPENSLRHALKSWAHRLSGSRPDMRFVRLILCSKPTRARPNQLQPRANSDDRHNCSQSLSRQLAGKKAAQDYTRNSAEQELRQH